MALNPFDVGACRADFVAALDSALRDALLNFDKECAAAIRIQTACRGMLIRERLVELNYYAAEIQRVFRGHQGRRRTLEALRASVDLQRASVKGACARTIQKLYRGFRSRKYAHDFFARKAYIRAVTQQGEVLRAATQQALEQQVEKTLADEDARARAEFERVTASLHHLVSTRAVPGVYNPPWAAAHPEQAPSAFDVPLEAHLQASAIRQLRTTGYNRPIAGAATTLGNTAAVLVPAYAAPHSRQTLQAASPYAAAADAERTRRRLAELGRLDTRPFAAGGRADALAAPPPASLLATAGAFAEPWLLARTERDLENAPAVKGRRVSAVPFVTAAPRGGRAFEEVERSRARATHAVFGPPPLPPTQQQQQQGAAAAAAASPPRKDGGGRAGSVSSGPAATMGRTSARPPKPASAPVPSEGGVGGGVAGRSRQQQPPPQQPPRRQTQASDPTSAVAALEAEEAAEGGSLLAMSLGLGGASAGAGSEGASGRRQPPQQQQQRRQRNASASSAGSRLPEEEEDYESGPAGGGASSSSRTAAAAAGGGMPEPAASVYAGGQRSGVGPGGGGSSQGSGRPRSAMSAAGRLLVASAGGGV